MFKRCEKVNRFTDEVLINFNNRPKIIALFQDEISCDCDVDKNVITKLIK